MRAGLASGFDEVRTKWSFADVADAIEWLEWLERKPKQTAEPKDDVGKEG